MRYLLILLIFVLASSAGAAPLPKALLGKWREVVIWAKVSGGRPSDPNWGVFVWSKNGKNFIRTSLDSENRVFSKTTFAPNGTYLLTDYANKKSERGVWSYQRNVFEYHRSQKQTQSPGFYWSFRLKIKGHVINGEDGQMTTGTGDDGKFLPWVIYRYLR